MLDDLLSEENEGGGIFESFSDVALCTLIVALLLVTLLAIGITQNLDVSITRNTFSGGVMRPSLYLECTTPEWSETQAAELTVERALFSGRPYVAVHLFGPSLAHTTTDVRGGGTVALGADKTFAQQQDLSLYQFLKLVPGIIPGSFEVDGQKTALLLPEILNKQIVYEPQSETGYRAYADARVTMRLLEQVWPIYGNPVYPVRRPEDYSHSRTRILVEIMNEPDPGSGEHRIVIGHMVYQVPSAFKDGSLAWLGGFSSGLTEIVFLGETWSDEQRQTNKRIEFFESAGFDACADYYRAYVFPSGNDPAEAPLRSTLREMGVQEQYIGARVRDAAAQRDASSALLEGRLKGNEGGYLPPLLAYPEAWAAYVEDCELQSGAPPAWFYRDFLDKLGFDRLAIERTGKESL